MFAEPDVASRSLPLEPACTQGSASNATSTPSRRERVSAMLASWEATTKGWVEEEPPEDTVHPEELRARLQSQVFLLKESASSAENGMADILRQNNEMRSQAQASEREHEAAANVLVAALNSLKEELEAEKARHARAFHIEVEEKNALQALLTFQCNQKESASRTEGEMSVMQRQYTELQRHAQTAEKEHQDAVAELVAALEALKKSSVKAEHELETSRGQVSELQRQVSSGAEALEAEKSKHAKALHTEVEEKNALQALLTFQCNQPRDGSQDEAVAELTAELERHKELSAKQVFELTQELKAAHFENSALKCRLGDHDLSYSMKLNALELEKESLLAKLMRGGWSEDQPEDDSKKEVEAKVHTLTEQLEEKSQQLVSCEQVLEATKLEAAAREETLKAIHLEAKTEELQQERRYYQCVRDRAEGSVDYWDYPEGSVQELKGPIKGQTIIADGIMQGIGRVFVQCVSGCGWLPLTSTEGEDGEPPTEYFKHLGRASEVLHKFGKVRVFRPAGAQGSGFHSNRPIEAREPRKPRLGKTSHAATSPAGTSTPEAGVSGEGLRAEASEHEATPAEAEAITVSGHPGSPPIDSTAAPDSTSVPSTPAETGSATPAEIEAATSAEAGADVSTEVAPGSCTVSPDPPSVVSTPKKIVSEEMLERRRLEKVALESMVEEPSDEELDEEEEAAPAEASWWESAMNMTREMEIPDIEFPDISPQEVLEFFMQIAVTKIMMLGLTGFVKVELSVGQVSSWAQANISEESLKSAKKLQLLSSIKPPSPLPKESGQIFADALDKALATNADNLGTVVMSKGGTFKVEIPYILSLSVEFEVAEVD
eukprot:TRINITY_DN6198_c0_g6_i1.p1 TRINITY_DN6198_c0_g6~~TRINITY_DN6198_c0_g6_i1.p1  ORF type:complete len:833 (+),score=235.02 TRINITY_DN6198_c0_g6_i1:257-2755(+)